MRGKTNLTGNIIVSQPKSEDPYFSQSLILIAKHSPSGAWGIMVNKPTTAINLESIMRSVGVLSHKQDKVFIGGPVDSHRVHILHSLDWSSSTTMAITDDIGVTNDVGILTAIAANEGPALFRTCVGMCGWEAGQLEGEIRGDAPWKQQNRWLNTTATIQSVFHLNEAEQWQQGIELVAKDKISSWL